MRIVYMGTPSFAANILKILYEFSVEGGRKPLAMGQNSMNHAALLGQTDLPYEPVSGSVPPYSVVAVYTQPDKPAGRGNKLHAPESKVLAQDLGIPVFQPRTFRNNPEALEELKALKPDMLIVAAYGMILPQEVLDIPVLGCYNIHASLLPQYRGAAPVQRAIINGDAISGVTIMRMEAGLDTGPMLLQQAVPISPEDTSGSLLDTLSEYGANLIVGAIGMIAEQRAAFIPQNDALATHAAKLTKTEAIVDWTRSAREIDCHIRGFFPNPGATTTLFLPGRDPIAVRLEEGKADAEPVSAQPGTILNVTKKGIQVACGQGSFFITRLRLSGKPSMDAAAFKNGYAKDSDLGRLGNEG